MKRSDLGVIYLIQVLDSKGKMRMENGLPFDPYYSEHDPVKPCSKVIPWQHSWFVPQDVYGLIAAHGGMQNYRQTRFIFTVALKSIGAKRVQ